MRKLLILALGTLVVGCSTHPLNNTYNRPSALYGEDIAYCNVDHSRFKSYVSRVERDPGKTVITYRRPILASSIYRGDCGGDSHTCNVVNYKIETSVGTTKVVKANEYGPTPLVDIEGSRIQRLTMIGEVTGRGVDRRSGNVIACPF